MNSLAKARRRNHENSHRTIYDGSTHLPIEVLLTLDRMVVEVSMQLYNVSHRDRSRMRRQNRRLHAAVRENFPRLFEKSRSTA